MNETIKEYPDECWPNRIEWADEEMYNVYFARRRGATLLIASNVCSSIPCRIYTTRHNPCAYIQVERVLARIFRRYPERMEGLNDVVHGGITFQGELEGEEGTWLGWDYAHPGDYIAGVEAFEGDECHRWKCIEILEDIYAAVKYCINANLEGWTVEKSRERFRNGYNKEGMYPYRVLDGFFSGV